MMLTANSSLLGSFIFGLIIIGPHVASALDVIRAIVMHEVELTALTLEQINTIVSRSSVEGIRDTIRANCVAAIEQAKNDGYKPLPAEPSEGLVFSYVKIFTDFDVPMSHETKLAVICAKTPSMIVVDDDYAYIALN